MRRRGARRSGPDNGGSAVRYKSRRILIRQRQHLRQLDQTVTLRGKREIARAQETKLTNLVQHVDQGRDGTNLSSAIRVFVLNHMRADLNLGIVRDD